MQRGRTFWLPERGSMSASVMQLHHFMFKDSNLVRSGNGTKKSTEDKSEEGKTLLCQVQKQYAELIFRRMVIITQGMKMKYVANVPRR